MEDGVKFNPGVACGAQLPNLGADLFLDRAHIKKNRFAPELVPSKVPHDQSPHAHTFPRRPKAEERASMGPAPFVFGYDALVVRRKEPLYTDFEIRKTCPMFPISLGHLLRADEGLRYAANIVKAIGGHSRKELFHIVRAFGVDVLSKDGEPILWYPHLVNLPDCLV
jgi:hypothetical protein